MPKASGYIPIRRDDAQAVPELPLSGFARWLKKLQQRCPLRIYYELPKERRYLVSCLGDRPRFPHEAWQETGLPPDEVEAVLSSMRQNLELPNHHLLPDDEFLVVISDHYDDLAGPHMLLDLKWELNIQISVEELNEILGQNIHWPLGEFVRLAIERRRQLAGSLQR